MKIVMMKNHKVRFNLGRGENYMKWKVEHKNGWVRYYNPAEVQLIMKDCVLKNNRTAALKIFTGETTKVVCAWVICKTLEIKSEGFTEGGENRIKYNPRNLPYWELNGTDMDSSKVNEIISVDYGLYLVK
jgi:hypothetical protein